MLIIFVCRRILHELHWKFAAGVTAGTAWAVPEEPADTGAFCGTPALTVTVVGGADAVTVTVAGPAAAEVGG